MKARTKRSVLTILLLGISLLGSGLLAGCGESGDGAQEGDYRIVSMDELSAAMVDPFDFLPDMMVESDEAAEAPETLLSSVSAIDYDKVEHFFIAYSSEGKADEIVVILLKDPKDDLEASEHFQTHIQGRVQLYQQYDPAQAARMEKAEVVVDGPYVLLLCCDDNEAVLEAFQKAIGE